MLRGLIKLVITVVVIAGVWRLLANYFAAEGPDGFSWQRVGLALLNTGADLSYRIFVWLGERVGSLFAS